MATKPLVIPNVFASEGTGSPNNIPLLDADFTQLANYFNDGSFFSTRGTDTGAVNAYVVSLPSGYVPSQYNPGMRITVNPANSNTGASTINVNALGSVAIVRADSTPLTGGELSQGVDTDLVYDGTSFRLMSTSVTPLITSVRLRSFNAVGNPNFEVDQRNAGNTVTSVANATLVIDRWKYTMAGSYVISSGQQSATLPDGCIPGTNYRISRSFLRTSVTTAEPTLGASDNLLIYNIIEGTQFRELSNDVHSISILCRSNVANLKFGLTLQDQSGAYNLGSLCTLGAANTLTLITLPNLPIWPSGGTFVTTPSAIAYYLIVVLAAGSSKMLSTAGTWQNASGLVGVPGQSNFVATVGNTFDLMFIQHEPGPICTQLMDLDFDTNLSRCQRYYQKTYNNWAAPAAVTTAGVISFYQTTVSQLQGTAKFSKTMSKIPTVTIYNWNTGAANSLYHNNGTVYAVSSVNNIGDSGFDAMTVATMPAVVAGAGGQFHYTADTGW